MCKNCWVEDGAPKIVNDKTLIAAILMSAVYDNPGCGAGGHGHIVFDDSNFETEHIEYCLSLPPDVYEEYPVDSYEFVNVVLRYLLTLTLE